MRIFRLSSHQQPGQVLLLSIVFIILILLLVTAFITFVFNKNAVVTRLYRETQAFELAEAGIDKATWCLNHSSECSNPYGGETATLGVGEYTTVVTAAGLEYEIVSTGTVANITKVIKVTLTEESVVAGASFFYGVQVGAGGLTLLNNSFVVGNVYSNGSITGGNGTYATGDVYVAGGTSLTADQQQTLQTSDYSFGDISTREDIAQSFKPGVDAPINYIRLYIKKVGSPSNATVRITEDNNGKPKTSSLTSGTMQATQVTSSYGWVTVSFSSNPVLTKNQIYWIVVDMNSSNASKYYVLGMHDNAGYGNGQGMYSASWSSGNWTGAGGDFTFETWMGGVDTFIDGLEVGDTDHTCDNAHYATHHGDAHAHKILNSDVECDAFYTTDPADIQGTAVGRTKHPNSTDPPPEAMPISDGQIIDWKNGAVAGSTINGDYILDDASASLGPVKITGNMTIKNNANLTITGNVWVVGNVLFDNNCSINIDTGYSTNSGLLIADGKITVQNNCTFSGSGSAGSYILILSTNTSLDGASPAIDISNNAQTVIFYASKGLINVSNNAQLKEVTGYMLKLDNNASVTYESGLASAQFADGPGGVWTIKRQTWNLVK